MKLAAAEQWPHCSSPPSISEQIRQKQLFQSRWTPALKTTYASLRGSAEATACGAAPRAVVKRRSLETLLQQPKKRARAATAGTTPRPTASAGRRKATERFGKRLGGLGLGRGARETSSPARAARRPPEGPRRPPEPPADPHRPRRSPGATAAPEPWCATSSTPRRARKNGSTSSSA